MIFELGLRRLEQVASAPGTSSILPQPGNAPAAAAAT